MSAVGSSVPAFAHVNKRAYGGFDYENAMHRLFADGGLVGQKAAFTSSDTGRSNDVFGAVLWNQANTATPAYGLLPKIDATGAGPQDIDSPRPQTFRAAFSPPSMDTPAEGGSWGTPKTFSGQQVKADPHHSQLPFEQTIIAQIEARLQDDVPLDQIESLMDEYWRERFEIDGILRAIADSTPAYGSDNAIVPLDRVVASSDEESTGTNADGTTYSDGDLDVYDIDRSSDTWADSVVDHNDGTLRQLTSDVVDSTIESLLTNGANYESLAILTGTDTGRVMDEIKESQVRYDGNTALSTETVEGETTRPGATSNKRFKDWDGIPIVESHNMWADSLSTIFILDIGPMENPDEPGEMVPKIGVETYFGPLVERAGPGQPTNTFATDNLADQVGFLMTHEVVCRRFNHQAKVTDIEE